MNNKREIREFFAWIKEDNHQIKWLLNYLNKHKIDLRFSNYPRDKESIINAVISALLSKYSDDSLELFVKKAKAAWRQYERRNITNKASITTINCELKTKVHKEVRRIAKYYNIPINVAYEELVKKACEIEQSKIRKDRQNRKLEAIQKRQDKHLSVFLNHIEPTQKPEENISRDKLKEMLMSEMYERHCLAYKLINNSKLSSDEKKDAINKEKARYDKNIDALY